MLLHSSQVSVTISSLIAFIFTVALFLSGYILQQQTVRELRAQIRPQLPRATYDENLNLPIELQEKGSSEIAMYSEGRGVVDAVLGEIIDENKQNAHYTDETIEKSMIGATRWQKKRIRDKLKRQNEQASKDQKAIDTKRDSPSHNPLRSLSRAERLKLIKSQILTEGEGEAPKGYRRRL